MKRRSLMGTIQKTALLLLGLAALSALPAGKGYAQNENLMDRISNERMARFEENLTNAISGGLSRYISRAQYVLTVKVIWNPDIIPAVQAPGLSSTRQKLPGFPIFVASPGAEGAEESAPPFARMVVKVLLDETLPEYYERFVRKVVPIVARFEAARGDQVVVLKETFPVKSKEDGNLQMPPTLPEKELMKKLDPFSQQRMPPQRPVPLRGSGGQQRGRQKLVPRPDPIQAAQAAFDSGQFKEALGIVQQAFQQATTNQSRGLYLGMEGSIYFALKNKDSALVSWKRALTFDPTNLEVQRVVQFLEENKKGDQ